MLWQNCQRNFFFKINITLCLHSKSWQPTTFKSTTRELLFCYCLTGLSLQSSLRTSGAIQPSVPGTPDLLLKLWRPTASFLHKPKSEIMARTRPCALGMETRMLCGFRSLWTERKIWRGEKKGNTVGYLYSVDCITCSFDLSNNESKKIVLYSVVHTYVERVQMGQSWHGLLKKHNWL